MPPRMITGTAMYAGVPPATSFASRMPVKAMTEPTARSMPAVTMTNVMPTARISRYALSSSRAEMLRAVMKSPRRNASAPRNSRSRITMAANVGIVDECRLMNVWYPCAMRLQVVLSSGTTSTVVTMPPPPWSPRRQACPTASCHEHVAPSGAPRATG